jgi:O-antigen/teichoic acid export membrane protein
MIGVNLRRKTILEFVYMVIASGSNLILNLFLIPRYGEMGAAASTLASYIILATVSYIVNKRIYPIDYEIGTFLLKLFIGVGLYLGGRFLASGRPPAISWSIIILTLLLYAVILLAIGGLTPKKIVGLVGFVRNTLGKKGQNQAA